MRVGWRGRGGEQGVEGAEALLGGEAVAVDPGGQLLEPGGHEVHGAALRVARARDEAGPLEHLDVLRDRLERDGVRGGELPDGERAEAQPGDEGTPYGVRQGEERAVETVLVLLRGDATPSSRHSLSTFCLIN